MDGYWLYEWDEETSQFDPNGVWMGNYYGYRAKIWVPDSISPNDDEAISDYIDQQQSEAESGRANTWA